MLNELAIDAEGEPFDVPSEVIKWRVRRVEGRGKPGLVYLPGQGKPLLLDLHATHADLARKAGAGRYRLDPVDATGRRIEGAPVAVTGPLEAVDDTTSEGSGSFEETSTMPITGRRPSRMEDMLSVVVEANTRVVEKVVSQLGGVMDGITALLGAAHGAGLTNRVPLFLPAPTPKERTEIEHAAPASGMPEWLTVVIQQAVQAIVPMMVTKLPSLSGLPLSALVDWSKAAPTHEAPQPSARVASPVMHAPLHVQAASAPVTAHAWPGAVESTGAAPVGESPGAVPAAAPAAGSRAVTDDSTALATHVTQVWQALSLPEQGRAYQLIELLTPDERTAWVADLARLTLPEAVARVRAVIQRQTPAQVPQLGSGPPGEDKSS